MIHYASETPELAAALNLYSWLGPATVYKMMMDDEVDMTDGVVAHLVYLLRISFFSTYMYFSRLST